MLASNLLQNLLNEAVSQFNQGKFDAAEKNLFTINQKNPNLAIVWFLLGAVYVNKCAYREAESALKRSIKLQPNYPEALNNLAVVYERQNNLNDAKKFYLQAIKQKADYASALFNLGNIFQQEGNIDQAIKYYNDALKTKPQYINALNNLGLCYKQQNNLQEAISIFRTAYNLAPNDIEVLVNMASVLNNQKAYVEAIELSQRAIHINPNKPEIYNNLGIAYQKLAKLDLANSSFARAIELNSNYSEAYTNLGNLYKDQEKYDLAIDYYNKALAIDTQDTSAWNNMAICYLNIENYSQTLNCYQHVLTIEPDSVSTKYNLGTYYLSQENLVQGWPYYQFRTSLRHELAQSPAEITFEQLKNKNILLTKEQGIGDEIFFLRYVEKLATQTPHIDYLATEKIAAILKQIPLLKNIFISQPPNMNHYDYVLSVGDLPLILQTENNDFPKSLKFYPDSIMVSEIRDYLKTLGPPPYIGITWRAGQNVDNFLFKNVPIDNLWSAIEELPGTILILQRMPQSEELSKLHALAKNRNIFNLSDYNEDIPKMLALLQCIDEYIGVSNTNMHLLAALNKSAHVLVSHLPEWRWLFTGDESPWFPDFSIARQDCNKSWVHACNQVKQILQRKYLEIPGE